VIWPKIDQLIYVGNADLQICDNFYPLYADQQLNDLKE
jgi:hypothetical protein